MYLISEVQGEIGTGHHYSRDKSMHSVSRNSSDSTNFQKATSSAQCISTENLHLKLNKTSLRVSAPSRTRQGNKKKEERVFKCFKEDDVITFNSFKPSKLPYNLVKGDDDEDTEDEDISNGRRFTQFHLAKA